MPAKNSPMLTLSNLTKSYNDQVVVDEVNITISAGKCFALIGPNGAGKTTIAKMVCGLARPDTGTVEVVRSDIAKSPAVAKKNLGYIPDDPFTYPYLTGRQILQYVGDLHGISRRTVDRKIRKYLGFYPLAKILDSRFGDYSRGNRQKISIIAALLHDPKLLVIDEPIVGLDAESQVATKTLLKEFMGGGGAILLSTHTLSFAELIATHVGFLIEGKLLTQGKLSDVKKKLKKESGDLQELYFQAIKSDER